MNRFKILLMNILISIVYVTFSYLAGRLYFEVKKSGEGAITAFEAETKITILTIALFCFLHIWYAGKKTFYQKTSNFPVVKKGYLLSFIYAVLLLTFTLIAFINTFT